MPLNVRKLCDSLTLILAFSVFISAQTATPTTPTPTSNQTPTPNANAAVVSSAVPTAPAPSAAEVMRARVAKAKAFIAVKNYNAAIYELENIRRESSDQSVQSVIDVLLMNSFLEQGDYKRAQDFLGELAKAQKANKPNATANYFAAAGQVVRGARLQAERYKALGLSVADRNLPAEAVGDLQKMRDTLETVVAQSKTIGADKKQTADAMALLEEATNARSALARDDYDAKRWKDEVADARETLANSQSVILNAAGEPTTEPPASNVAASVSPSNPATSATSTASNNQQAATTTTQNAATAPRPVNPVPDNAPKQAPVKVEIPSQSPNQMTAQTDGKPNGAPSSTPSSAAAAPPPPENTTTAGRERRIESASAEPKSSTAANQNQANSDAQPSNANPRDAAPKSNSPMLVGSLVEYATQKTQPVYPSTARTLRTSGIVRVDLTIDENGQVAEVQKTSGPALLQRAASDAIKKWRFKPFVRDGEPVRAVGFVNFNFSL